MASLMENLIDVLDRESTEYEALLSAITAQDTDHCRWRSRRVTIDHGRGAGAGQQDPQSGQSRERE